MRSRKAGGKSRRERVSSRELRGREEDLASENRIMGWIKAYGIDKRTEEIKGVQRRSHSQAIKN